MTSDVLGNLIIDHLQHASRRDQEKGGIGTRTTREIADRADVQVQAVRKKLNLMWGQGTIEKWEDGCWSLPSGTAN